MAETSKPIIVGGGLAGLSAAWHLAARGLAPIVLESHPFAFGGRLRGGEPEQFEYNNKLWAFNTEHAVHGFWANYSNLFRLLESLSTPPKWKNATDEVWFHRRAGRVKLSRAGRALRQGFMPAPLHYLQLFFQPEFWGMLTIADVARLPAILYSLFYIVAADPKLFERKLRSRYLADFIKYWGPNTRDFMVGLSRSGLSAEPDEIPLSGFVAFLRFYSTLNKRHWKYRYLSSISSEELISPILEALRSHKVTLQLDTRVETIFPSPRGWEINTNKGLINASQIILATDASSAQHLLNRSHLKSDGVESWPRTMPPAILRLWFSKSLVTDYEAGIFTGEFMLDNFFWLHKIYKEYREWHAATGGAVLEAHIYGPAEELLKSDETLLATGIHDINMAFPELAGARVHQTLTRLENSHTVFEVNQSQPQVKNRFASTGLYLAGDWVQHPHPSLYMERSVVTGIAAANCVLEEANLDPWEILSPIPPERSARALESLLQAGVRILTRSR